jgi:hypothetical protein
MDAYLTYRIRFFDYDKNKEKYWTSRDDTHWWCKTIVGNDYFNVDEEQARQRSRQENDPQYGRVVTDVSFRPLKHNPDASKENSKISRAAVWKLRHTDPTDFVNGVAMNIGSFLEYMIQECKWIEDAPWWENKNRFRASDFSTPEFECQWDINGVCHMLEMCSNYPRFALMTLRKPRCECASDEVARGMLTSDGQHVDFVIAILAMQGHTLVKAHPHLFGWHRLDWRECPMLFHQTDARRTTIAS